jgi:hypothetical protein
MIINKCSFSATFLQIIILKNRIYLASLQYTVPIKHSKKMLTLPTPFLAHHSALLHKKGHIVAKHKTPSESRRLHRQALPRAQDPSVAPAEDSIDDGVPRGCSRYSVLLFKPLGIVLEENTATGAITVAELVTDGNADKSGEVRCPCSLGSLSVPSRTDEHTL